MEQSNQFKVNSLPDGAIVPEAVLRHWPSVWKSAGFDKLETEWRTLELEFVEQARNSDLKPLILVSTDAEGTVLGSIHCQIWAGPVPWVVKPHVFRIGTVWGLHVDEKEVKNLTLAKAIRMELVEKALAHLRQVQCSKVVTLAPTAAERENMIGAGVGFQQGNMLTLDLTKNNDWKRGSPCRADKTPFLCSGVGPEHDATVITHWRRMWTDVGIPEEALLPDMETVTAAFIKQARERLSYQTFLARCARTQRVIGTVSCQVWEGPFPKIVRSNQLGTIWAVFVDKEYRRQGVATALLRLALQHLKDVGCDSAILIAASEGGQRLYENKLGFHPNNALVLDLAQLAKKDASKDKATSTCPVAEEKKQEDNPALDEVIQKDLEQALCGLDVSINDQQATALRTATTQQLVAVYQDHPQGFEIVEAITSVQKRFGTFIDPQDNWFTRRLAKAKETSFGGGFDLKQLENPTVLASKFDRLANQYDHWTVGNQSKVESFIVRCAKASSALHNLGRATRVLDVACGIGLQGQVLRMCGFRGELIGTDISSGMVRRVIERGCYSRAYVADANQSLSCHLDRKDSQQLYDIVIVTGAMELLNHQRVLSQIAKMTRPGAELWLSFQHEMDKQSPTQHQNVQGITKECALDLVRKAGFCETIVEACPDAFYTPSPAQDGTLLAVPYLFILAKKES